MRAAAHHLLNLALAGLGLLLATAAAHATAQHGAALWTQAALGLLAYAATTGTAGRATGTHPVDAVADSITALATTTAATITLTATVLLALGRFVADHTGTRPAPLTKTA